MQLSQYLKIYPYAEHPDHLLLFSTKKASKVLLSKETFRQIEKGIISPSDEELLSSLGMIVDDLEAEKHSVLSLFDKLNKKNSLLSITVVLNLDCNFACTYCYEDGRKGKRYMSGPVAGRVVDFVKEKFTPDKNSLAVIFYGGEPLLSPDHIKTLSRELNSFTKSRSASYTFSLVTNGSLLKRELIQELVQLGLNNVRVTLDGPADLHNQTRPFKSGKGSFHTIISNIKKICDIVDISIGGNFDKDNHAQFANLMDYLQDEGLTPDKISGVKFSPIVATHPGDRSEAGFHGGCRSIDEPWLAGAEVELREEILKRGYRTPKLNPMSCNIEMQDEYVVNYDGDIYKCPAFLGLEDFVAGDVQTGVRDYSDIYKTGMWKNEECAVCAYLPLCFGGCRYFMLTTQGDINKLNCQKPFYDASLETLVKQDIKYGGSAEAE